MLGKEKLMGFCAIRDAAQARGFYVETLGLREVSDDGHALVVDANGTMLRLQKVGTFTPHPFTALGWQVTDIAATVTQLAARNVHCEKFPGLAQDANGVWHAPGGAQVAWFKDPDGNLLSLTQF
jgi:catechol 2,3-dioxygenase-like lactoylglutathione lyase family enzyme